VDVEDKPLELCSKSCGSEIVSSNSVIDVGSGQVFCKSSVNVVRVLIF
jgi:hypothetical protein